MDREVLDRWCERGILALVLAILGLAPLATGAMDLVPSVEEITRYAALAFPIVQGLTIGVLVLWGVRLWFSPRPQLLWPPLGWAVVVFAGYGIARYFTADIELVARQELMQALVYVFLFLAIINNLHRQEYTQVLVFALLFLGMAEACYALFQFITGSDHVWQFVTPYKHRGTGTYINPNHLGAFLGMLLPLGLAYTLFGRVKPVVRVLTAYASLMILAGLAVTLSRGAWIGAGIAALCLFSASLFKRSLRLPALALLVLLVGAGAYLIPKNYLFKVRVDRLSGEVSADTYSRYQIWEAATRMWRDHVWWGVGPGHFDYRFRAYRPSQVQSRPVHVHNDYLETLADWGVVGAGIVAVSALVLGLGVIRTWGHVRRPERDFGNKLTNKYAFVLGASLGLLALLVHSAVDFNLRVPANALLAVALLALLTTYQRFATERYWMSVRAWHRGVLSVALLAGVVCLGSQCWKRIHESVWLQRAAQAPFSSRAQVSALEQAFAAEPKNFNTAYALGQACRIQSFEGNKDSAELAQKAMAWYERSMKLQPFDPYSCLGYGMCLDFLERNAEAEPYFLRADELDPAGYYTAAYIGRHYADEGVRNYAAARVWLERSIRLQWDDNPIARNYLDIVKRRMLEAAAPPK